MDFQEAILNLAARAKKQASLVQTEEATKQAFVLPFIQALGYDLYDPEEVIPEFTADVGVKKGEKIDYAILQQGKPILLIECKWNGKALDEQHRSQLYRYFSVTEARIAILTNGLVYQFYADLEKPNTLDEKPFLEFDLMDPEEELIPELKKLSKPNFDLSRIISNASELKYTKAIREILSQELHAPSDEFTRFFAAKIYSGRLTHNVLDRFREITKRSLNDFINGEINARLKSIMSQTKDSETESEISGEILDISEHRSKKQRQDEKIDTTREEKEGFLIVLKILRERVNPQRIFWRDVETYFNILLDDSIRKPLCRLYFNTQQKYIGLFDPAEKRWEKQPIQSIPDIQGFADQLYATLESHDRPT